MKIIASKAGLFGANCYIVYDETTKDGIIVDPGGNPKGIFDICKKNELNIKYIILTHGHGDHIGGVYEIKLLTNAKVLMNQKDEYLVQGGNQRMIPAFRSIKAFEIDEYIKDGDCIKLNGFSVEIIETPGHTPGGVCLKIDDILFSGDTLFKGSIGRTDFELGSQYEIINSIRKKLLVLPDETKVYPGHEGETTILFEKKYNPYVYYEE